MKNVTITLDEDVARWARIRAAEDKYRRQVLFIGSGRSIRPKGKTTQPTHLLARAILQVLRRAVAERVTPILVYVALIWATRPPGFDTEFVLHESSVV